MFSVVDKDLLVVVGDPTRVYKRRSMRLEQDTWKASFLGSSIFQRAAFSRKNSSQRGDTETVRGKVSESGGSFPVPKS